MISWNPQALEQFNLHCEAYRDALLAAGADPDEVFADWKSLVESHSAAANEEDVGMERVEVELLDLVPPTNEVPSPPLSSPSQASPAMPGTLRVWFHRSVTTFLWILGVALPLGVLLFELIAGLCSEILFDPMPTWIHALLIALVPAANAWALLASSRSKHSPWMGRLNGFAIGISAFYALQFAIITPFAAMAIIYLGIGLIPLSPLLSFGCALILRRRLRLAAVGANNPMPSAWWHTAIPAFLLMILLGIPQWVIQVGAAQANDPDPAVRVRAVRMIRAIGNKTLLLRRCYRGSEHLELSALFLAQSLGYSPSRSDAQKAYYRVTGTPYNATPPPRIKGLRGQTLMDAEWFDAGLGGDRVAARIKDLSLSQSRLDGRVDSTSGIAYLEWTLEFHNASKQQREARALIELPPGAMVSRVTLWINDEPCEAAFGGRSQTRKAYQQVAVRQRRDPVLVTTAGPDRILLQCFPVPIDGSMKTRIGITVPLLVLDATPGEATLRLPAFIEQNFTAKPNLATSAWIESDVMPLSTSDGLKAIDGKERVSIRGHISADDSEPASFLSVPIAFPYPPILSRDDRIPDNQAIVQTLQLPESTPAFPTALAIVIDGSARMGAYVDTLREILTGLPADTQVLCLLASDEPQAVEGSVPKNFLHFAGGCDNGAALGLAAEWAATHENAPILWLHAAQPIESSDLESLRQAADFSRGNLVIHSHQFGPGANRISEKVADLRLVRPLPIIGDSAEEILAALRGGNGHWKRKLIPETDTLGGEWLEGSSHIARLWGAGEINRLTAPHRKGGRDEAIGLAQSWQLVTPISGAVVLETAAQYKANNLTPANTASTPGIVPEPATWLLLMTGAPLLLALRRRKAA